MANTPQTYTSAFRSLTPEKLAAIIVNEQDYNVDAVKAARLELTARMLPMEELDRLYALAEEQKIKSGSDGMHIGIGDNKKVELLRKSFRERTKSSIWTRTNILKFILAFMVYDFLYSLYNIASGAIDPYTNQPGFTLYLAAILLDPIILLLIIVIGIKGHKAAWWGAFILFSLGIISRISNAYHTYLYYEDFSGEDPSGLTGLLSQFVDDPYTSGINLLIAVLFFYLILRKDTRIACGVSKAKPKGVDDLDHLI